MSTARCVHYDVIDPTGQIFESNLNDSQICTLTNDGFYTIILHPDPMRIASDSGSFYQNLVNYGYAILFLCVIIFLAGNITGVFLGQIIRRRG
jgi:hypothetical protein